MPPDAPLPAGSAWGQPAPPDPDRPAGPDRPPAWGPPRAWGGPQEVAEPRARTALILAVVGLFVFLVPSVIALVLASRVRRPGAGRATIKTAAWARTVGIVGLFTSVILTGSVVAGASLVHTTTSYADLPVGACFNRTTHGTTVSVAQVSCAKLHNAEAVGRVTAPDGPWPGADGFAQIAGPTCGNDAEQYLHASIPRANIVVNYIFPERTAWIDGQRTVLCELRTTDGSKVSGPIGAGATTT